MPWNPDNDAVLAQIDSSIKNSPPNPPMINTAGVVRDALKGLWIAIRTQVQAATVYMDAIQASFIARSLNLSATIYIDGVNGNDARTGETNDNNAVTGRVKTFARIAALHSGKTYELNIRIVGNVVHDTDTNIKIPIVNLTNSANLTYSKKTALAENGVVYGDGTYNIGWETLELNFLNTGTINVEGHSGSTGAGNQFAYRLSQGANRLIPSGLVAGSNRLQIMNVGGSGTINVGNNTVFATPGGTGTDSYAWNFISIYRRTAIVGGAVVLGTNAIESLFQGDRLLPRSYTPTSSTDANVSEREIVADNNFLYRKNGGVIKKIALTAF